MLARKITHKNVVRIYDLGEADGLKFFTMEFIEGESLKALIRRAGRSIPPAEAVEIARQMLGGLQEAHDQGVVHRDLKPQNIMVDASGSAPPHGLRHRALHGAPRGMTATGRDGGHPRLHVARAGEGARRRGRPPTSSPSA